MMDWRLLLLGFLFFLLAMGGMAIGIVLGRKPLKGSCGGVRPETGEPDPDASCEFCETDPEDCPNKNRRRAARSGAGSR